MWARRCAELKRGLPLCATAREFRRANVLPRVVAGVDVGDVYVGLALSDEMQNVARPYKGAPLRRDAGFATLIAQLRRVLVPKDVTGLVVGYPLTLEQHEESQCVKTLLFLQSLCRRDVGLPTVSSILLVNEVYSSHDARLQLREAGVRRDRMRALIDHHAAAEILQEYLDDRFRRRM